MEYMEVRKAAEDWGLQERRVTALCRLGRIEGAKKVGKLWLIPSDAEKPVDKRTKEYREVEAMPIEQRETVTRYTEVGAGKNAVRNFERIYRKSPEQVTFTPYRVCPLGAHVDHQNGWITGFAIDRASISPTDPK